MTSSALTVFDVATLRDLAEQAGMTAAELADIYLDDAVTSVPGLVASAAERDWGAVHRQAHSLKSSAATVGAMQVADTARRIESSTRGAVATPSEAEVLRLCESLRGQQAEFVAEIDRLRPSLEG